jgi:hypothetical protein
VGVVDQNHLRQTADLHGQQSNQRHERREYQLRKSITGGDLCAVCETMVLLDIDSFIDK